jgi:hypothetical protein
LIRRFLTVEARDRTTCADALKHEWIIECTATAPLPDTTIEEIKKFNARRRFRGAILATMAMQKFVKGMPMVSRPPLAERLASKGVISKE